MGLQNSRKCSGFENPCTANGISVRAGHSIAGKTTSHHAAVMAHQKDASGEFTFFFCSAKQKAMFSKQRCLEQWKILDEQCLRAVREERRADSAVLRGAA